MSESENTPSRKRPRAVLIILIVLFACSIGYIIYMTSKYRNQLEVQRTEYIESLTEMQIELDTANNNYLTLQGEYETQTQRIEGLLDSLKNYKNLEYTLYSYRKQIKSLQKTNQELFRVADSLNQLNKVLIAHNKQIESDLKSQAEENRRLVDQNIKMSGDIQNASTLDARSIRATGIIVSNSGKVTDTDRASRTDKIRVCFTLAKNNFAKKGERDIYVRVASPEKLIGVEKGNNFFVSGTERLQFSGKTNVFYENEDLDVCIFVDGIRGDFVSGKYLIAVYADKQFIGETQLYLK